MFEYGSNIKFSFKTNLFETNISGYKRKSFLKKVAHIIYRYGKNHQTKEVTSLANSEPG